MGWCHEFGPQIAETCEHPMTAGASSCSCTVCGTVCTGRFAGCTAVWARGPKEVVLEAPRVGGTGRKTAASPIGMDSGGDNGARWRLPLDPMRPSNLTRPTDPDPAPLLPPAMVDLVPNAAPPTVSNGQSPAKDERLEFATPDTARFVVAQLGELNEHVAALAERTTEKSDATLEKLQDEVQRLSSMRDFEAPDVTARFVVAQLSELNEHVAALTALATEKSEATLEKLHNELRRLSSMREVDLTEQAAGIFSAVQVGTTALESFATTVGAVTTDLRAILREALATIGGTEGLAAAVIENASEVLDVRQEIRNAFARIERDMAAISKQTREPIEEIAMNLNDDQLTFIVEAVTESVVSALTAQEPRTSSRRR